MQMAHWSVETHRLRDSHEAVKYNTLAFLNGFHPIDISYDFLVSVLIPGPKLLQCPELEANMVKTKT